MQAGNECSSSTAFTGIPIAIWGFFAIPNLPHITRAFYFNEYERQHGIERLGSFDRAAPEKLTLELIGGVFTNWRLCAVVLPYLMVGQANAGTKYFKLWLEEKGYSVVDTNTVITAGNSLSIVTAIGCGIPADYTGRNATHTAAVEVLVIAANIILSVWQVHSPVIHLANYLLYAWSAAQPIVIAWGHHLAAADPSLRPLLVVNGTIPSLIVSIRGSRWDCFRRMMRQSMIMGPESSYCFLDWRLVAFCFCTGSGSGIRV